MAEIYDVCVIGSGAGGGPVAATLAEAGYSVVVLEKGPWYPRQQFLKDEVIWCRRPTVKPDKYTEPQVEQWDDTATGVARAALTDRGVTVSEVQDLGGIYFAHLADPDGNTWVLQEIPARRDT